MAHALLSFLSAILVPLFFAGLAGSALVVVVTVIRDLRQVMGPDSTVVSDL